MDELRPGVDEEHLRADDDRAAEAVSSEPIEAVVDRLAAYSQLDDDHDAAVVEPAAQPGPEDVQLTEPAGSRRFGRRSREPKPAKPPKAAKERSDKRAKRLVGLKIGASQIAAAHVVNNGAPELVETFREPLEPGLVVGGEIRDPHTLGDALARFFALHKLPKKGVRLGVSNNRIGVRIFEIEDLADAQQLENAIRFRAE
jgi:hypothetical protein